MALSDDIHRQRYMDAKGHYDVVMEKRDIKSDRVILKRLNKRESITKEPKVISNLYELLKGL